MIVLDAAGFLAYLFREPGHELVGKYLENACISTVTLSEVVGRFVRDGIDALTLIRHIENTAIEIVPFTQDHALHTAHLIPKTDRYGLSLGDRACLGGIGTAVVALTADASWYDIDDLEVDIIQILGYLSYNSYLIYKTQPNYVPRIIYAQYDPAWYPQGNGNS